MTPRIVEIHNTYPNGLVGTDFPYFACKSFIEQCDRKAGYKGYFPVRLTDNAIALYLHGTMVSMIIFSINEEEDIIDICSAYTVEGYRKQNYYTELFEEFKKFRDEHMPDYSIHSEILVDNIPRMTNILENTGREEISRNYGC